MYERAFTERLKLKTSKERSFFLLDLLEGTVEQCVWWKAQCLFPDFIFEFKCSAALDVEACQGPQSWPQSRKINKKK